VDAVSHSRRLIIFEGPDGAGKSSAGRRVAAEMGAHYVHLGPFIGVSRGLARLYAEAIAPAVLGLADIVMDRCWLSELPYGRAFRGGQDRIGPEGRRLLERLALRCDTTLVLALPPYEEVEKNFQRRRGEEMLQQTEQLRAVYDHYDRNLRTALPTVSWSYLDETIQDCLMRDGIRSHPHDLNWQTAGSRRAKVVIVGEKFAEHHEFDALYQWPFGALSGGGCSRWLARKLEAGGIGEDRLLWVNADQPKSVLLDVCVDRHVVAMGREAQMRMSALGIPHTEAMHPQAWRRFHAHEDYPVIEFLRGIVK